MSINAWDSITRAKFFVSVQHTSHPRPKLRHVRPYDADSADTAAVNAGNRSSLTRHAHVHRTDQTDGNEVGTKSTSSQAVQRKQYRCNRRLRSNVPAALSTALARRSGSSPHGHPYARPPPPAAHALKATPFRPPNVQYHLDTWATRHTNATAQYESWFSASRCQRRHAASAPSSAPPLHSLQRGTAACARLSCCGHHAPLTPQLCS